MTTTLAQTRMVAGETLAFLVLPLAPQRSKSHPRIRGGHITMQADDKWAAWRQSAVMILRSQWRTQGREPLFVPVMASVVAVFPRPAKPRKTYTVGGVERPYPFEWTDGRVPYIGTPDWDQVGKAAIDVVKQAGILVDDPLLVGICEPFARWYAAVGERPSVSIELRAVGVER